PEQRFASYDALLDALADVAPDRTRPAGLIVRGLALAIDVVLVGLATALVHLALVNLGLRIESFPLVAAIYGIAIPARTGATYGKRALEIEITRDGARGGLGWRPAAPRFVVEWGP